LVANVLIDDGAAVYLNGQELVRVGLNPGATGTDWAARTVGDASVETFSVPAGALVVGSNLLAAELHQVNATSSDITFGLELVAQVVTRARDTQAPVVQMLIPAPDSTVDALTFVSVTFDEPVQGVDASDLLVNGVPATGLLVVSDHEYQFSFPSPSTGLVTFAWAPAHGITDRSPAANPFVGGSWRVTYDPNALRPAVVISEFMAANDHGIEDEDGTRADWIELFNPGPLEADLEGWFLTDDPLSPTKWRFPKVVLGVNRYLLVWASEKDRRDPARPLHTNFKLEKDGEYLALLDRHTNVVSAFVPAYPPQQPDISYGRDRADPSLVGYFTTPTPGAQNATRGVGFAPEPVFSLDSGVYTNNTLTITLSARSGTIRYTTDGSVPTTNSPVYSGPITISANTTIKARVFQAGLWPSPVVARTYILLDATAVAFSSNLPLLIMNTSGASIPANVAPGQPRARGSLVVIEPVGGRATLLTPPQFQGLAEFEIFGQTSAGFPKKPYNIELQDELGNDLAVSLLGMPAEADWKLRNPYTDKCMMNDFLGFELFEKMGHYQLRRRFVEVFVDTTGGKVTYPGDYHGILVLLEKIERGKDRVDIAELTPSHTNEPAITGGYIFKKDKDSTGDLDFSTTGGAGFSAQALKIHEPKPRQITTAQLNWLRNHLNQFERALYATNWLSATGTNHYSYYIDVDSFVDQHWIVEFTKQIDGYRLSSYFTKDRGGKIKWEPIWDWNLAFGNANYAEGEYTSGWYYSVINENQHIWLRRLICGTTSATGTTGDPDFKQKLIDRWSVLRTNVFNATNVNARVDELAAYLSEAAVRDFAKFPRLGTYVWPNPNMYVTPTTYAGIITNMKAWILGRYLWIDGLYPHVPALSHPGGLISPGLTLTLTAPSGGTIYYSLDGTDPRQSGGGIAPGARTYSGPITLTTNARVFARALRAGVWSGPNVATFYTSLPALRVTEIMYHPYLPSGNTNDPGDFEYIELTNVGAEPVNLVGVRFTCGIDFTFTPASAVTNLAPGGRVLIVKNRAAFLSRYPGLASLVAGEYGGSLDNAGERLTVEGPLAEPILDFRYDNSWYPLTDGRGFALVVRDESAPAPAWSEPSQWRASAFDGGSPGQPDPDPTSVLPVWVNEVLSHPIAPEVDAIELFNPNPVPADISYWYLSDNLDQPRKYRIPPGTVVGPYDFVVFYATNSFNSTNHALDPFGLSASGDAVWLFSGDGTGRLTGYYHGFDFGPAWLGTSFGRHMTSVGQAHYVAQSVNTLGSSNAPPRIGPVVISEFMFYPPELMLQGVRVDNGRDEFVELYNLTDQPVPLYDPNQPLNTWRLQDAVEFSFPTNAVLPPHSFALVVGFDPEADQTALNAFRARYNTPPEVPLFGPFRPRLDNRSGRLELRRPGLPNPITGAAPMVLVDRVDYGLTPPWTAAGGTGASIQKRALAEYGNDPAHWMAAGPTPGRERQPGEPPTIVEPPQPQTVVEETTVMFTVTVSGTGPFLYQWYWNSQPIDGAFSPTLVLTNVQMVQAGLYSVYVLSSSGSAMSDAVQLTVLPVPVIAQQPQGTNVQAGSNFTLRVVATGTGPLSYQWQFQPIGQIGFENIPGATEATFAVTNAQLIHSGLYRVLVTDSIGTRTSAAAEVNVLEKAAIVTQPPSQTVPVGGTLSITVQATGSQPLWYRWRKNASTLVWPGEATLTLANVGLDAAGTYDVIITNIANAILGGYARSSNAYVIVVAPPPASLTVAEGSNVTLSAVVSLPRTFASPFGWLFNGQPIGNGTNTSTSTVTIFTNNLVLTNFSRAQAGTYTLLLTNSLGAPAAFTTQVRLSGTEQPIPLSIRLEGTEAVVSWEDAGGGWVLEEATDLTPPGNWQPSSAVPVREGDRWLVRVPVTDPPQKFFRLRRS